MKKQKTGLPKDHISFTQIFDFMACPFYYYKKYHEKKQQTNSFARDFGLMQHNTAARINKAIIKDRENFSFEDVEAIYKAEFALYTFNAAAYTEGLENMRAYALQTISEKALILDAEIEIAYKIPSGAKILARIDRLDVPEPGAIEIVEFKSSPLVPSKEEVERDPQLDIYAYLIHEQQPETEKIFVSRQTFKHRMDAETGQVRGGYKQRVQKDIARLQGIGDFIQMVFDKITETKEWPSNPDLTGVCEYCSDKCEDYHRTIQETIPGINPERIDEVARHFIKLQSQKRAVENEYENSRRILERFFERGIAKELTVDDKIIFLSYHHKGPSKPQPASDYTRISIQKNITTEGAMDQLKKITRTARRKGIIKRRKK